MIVVTGAKGFIGSAVVWEINRTLNQPVVAVDILSADERNEYFEGKSVEKYLNKDELLKELQSGALKPSWIIHMGACSSTTEMNREYLKEVNTDYTRKLYEWCRDHNTPFIYASSGAVYGDGDQGFDDETDSSIFKPLNPYGESKVHFDQWVSGETQGPPQWYGLRFFNVYGPNEYHKGNMSSVVFKAFNQISNKGNLQLFRSHNADYKDGEQLRDFVYIKDITRWILELMNKKPESGIYNMGFGQARSWIDLASSVFKNMNKELNIDWIDIPENLRDKYQYFTKAKMDKLMAQGLSDPQWPLEKGVEDYVSNYLMSDNPRL